MGGRIEPQTAQRQSAPALIDAASQSQPAIADTKANLPAPTKAPSWLARNDLSLICLGIAAGAIAWATTFDTTTDAGHGNQKWVVVAALLFAIAGGVWGTRRSTAAQEIGVGCILALFASVLLYDGLVDPYWRETYAQGNRLAVTVTGAELLGFAIVLSIVREDRKKNFLSLMLWLWGVGWTVYFMTAPTEMQLKIPYLEEIAIFPLLIYFGGGIVAITYTLREETDNAPAAPQVARSQWANGSRKNWGAVNLDED